MKTVYILGAGADVVFGLPLADGLPAELDAFAKGDGKRISQSLRRKIGRFQFGFEKYNADRSENFAESILQSDSLSGKLKGALKKCPESDSINAVVRMLDQLDDIRTANSIDDATASHIAALAGENEDAVDSTLLRFRGVMLNRVPRTAILNILRGARTLENLQDDEKEALERVVTILANFEELLTEFFAGFYTTNLTSQRKYLYVSWMLWAYMRWKSLAGRSQVGTVTSFYDCISAMTQEEHVITFNYTDFGQLPEERTIRFHGDCLTYIRHDRGERIHDDSISSASTLSDLERFVDSLEMDVDDGRIYLPSIVPPAAMKAVINSYFVELWEYGRKILAEADLLVAVGYSFNPVDRHFNDLFRKAALKSRIVVINPDLEGVSRLVCDLIGLNRSDMTPIGLGELLALRSDKAIFVRAKSEEIPHELLSRLRNGW